MTENIHPQKKAFSYYRSYHEILKHLNDKQYVQLSRAINNVMFFEVHIDNISFEDKMVSALWASIRHCLQASIDGFTSKNKVQYNSLLTTPYKAPSKGGRQAPYQQGEGEGEEKGQVEGEEQGEGKLKPSGNGGKKPRITVETWEAYKTAYFNRYGVEPTRNATVNGQLSNFVKRIGEVDAPHVAAFFLLNNSQWYLTKAHSVASMLVDAEKLHTEWKRGKQITTTTARQTDRQQSNLNAWEQVEVKQ